jgi:uncharacterized integral membrane protein
MNASTWRNFDFLAPDLKMENFLMPFGFFTLGFVMIGLIVLWTGYRKKERWAWFVMLILLLFFIFPSNVLPVLLQIRTQHYQWSLLLNMLGAFREDGLLQCLTITPSANESIGIGCMAIKILIGILKFLVMSVALLLPVKAFFWRSQV